MLVVSRKKNEGIVINDDITVTMVEIRGDKVRLGVEVPRNVPVHRREVFDAIYRSKLAAEDEAGLHEASYPDRVVNDPETFEDFIRGLEDNPLSEEEIAQISHDFVESLSL